MAHILVIEDDARFREMLVHMLELDSHTVATAGDGTEAMHLLQRSRPDAIVTDILMPKMDGVEIMLELSRQSNPTPVIAMSGGRRSVTAGFNLDSAALVGARVTLAKPFTRADLRNALARVLP